MPISLVAGLAGVGKTELVLQAAARALDEPGWFPGGVLFVDLLGYDDERRLSPERALDGLLRALGMPAEHVPVDLQDRARLYRSVLATYAEQGRRILVVIDNASTAEQARALLPTDGTTAALVTSRHTLDVSARLHTLEVLDRTASVDLIRRILRQARGAAETRVDDQLADAERIAELFGHLPLALQISAALLADTPARPLASLAETLADAHRRLDRLDREDRAVRAAFDLSYQRLTDRQARLFRLLSLNPGPDQSTESAAQLAGIDHGPAEELLSDLARAHLVEPGHTWGRWRLHDLVRLYADQHGRSHADADRRDDALTRLFDHYTHTAEAAATHLDSFDDALSPLFSTRKQALAWLEDERLNLAAVVSEAAQLSRSDTAAALASALADFFEQRRYLDDWLTVTATAVAVCRRTGDRRREGTALRKLGEALRAVRRFEDAIDACTRAVTLYVELDERLGEGMALSDLGHSFSGAQRFVEAADADRRAAARYAEIGDRDAEGEARSLALEQARRPGRLLGRWRAAVGRRR